MSTFIHKIWTTNLFRQRSYNTVAVIEVKHFLISSCLPVKTFSRSQVSDIESVNNLPVLGVNHIITCFMKLSNHQMRHYRVLTLFICSQYCITYRA